MQQIFAPQAKILPRPVKESLRGVIPLDLAARRLDATTYTISDVAVGVPYYCVVTAYSSDTESGFSNEVSFTRDG